MIVEIINGPNMNVIERRGMDFSMKDIEALCEKTARELGLELRFFQSNSEGTLAGYIQNSNAGAIIINPAAYTFTSMAIPGALQSFKGLIIEVHLSNIFTRDLGTQPALTSTAAKGVVCGFGIHAYAIALHAVKTLKSSCCGGC